VAPLLKSESKISAEAEGSVFKDFQAFVLVPGYLRRCVSLARDELFK